LAKALNAKVTVVTVTESLPIAVTEPQSITMTEPLSIDVGSGHAGGWSAGEVDRFDAACKEWAGKVLEQAQAMAEHIGMLEGSNRSRVAGIAANSARDLFEAGLNEAACG
jgi:hypothetical protein